MAIGRTNAFSGGGGGVGAVLTVAAPAGVTVSVSKDGKVKTQTSSADGLAVFKGLETGTWTLTITDGVQTSTKPVSVTADYSTVIAFFSATINITYPSGSTCTCSDGSTTLTAPDTSGTWKCVVSNKGTWTVSCTDGTESTSETVEITVDGQSKQAILSYEVYLYNGESTGWESCVTPTDGWQKGSVSFSDGAILLDNDSNVAANGAATTIAHDLSKHKNISVTIDSKSTGLDTPNSGVWVCVATTNDFKWNPGAEGNGMGLPSGIVASKIISTTGTVTLDISGFPGSYYVAILASRNKKIYCTKVKLTK